MSAGRPKKPMAQLLYEGTYNPVLHGDRSEELAGDKVASINTPATLSPNAAIMFQNFVAPLCARGLVYAQDTTQLILAAYLIEAAVRANDAMVTGTTRKEISEALSDLNKSVNAFSAIAYKYYVSPVERARAVQQVTSGQPAMSLAERLVNARKEKEEDRSGTDNIVHKRGKKQSA